MQKALKRIRPILYYNLINIPGWRNRRKIVVIESDDWGSIRMPSDEVFQKFKNRGLNLSETSYNMLDTLESNDDLISLYDKLMSFRDSNGNNPVFTANMVVSNPDFVKIKEADYKEYYFEPVTETLRKYPGRDMVESLWKTGEDENIFHPQFHGREHVNVIRWINALQEKTPEIMLTFENNTTFSGNGDYNFMEVLDFNTPGDLPSMKQSLTEGMNMFEKLFGFRSKSFIPPCYTWDSSVEETLYKGGIRYIQGLVVQLLPTGSFEKYRKRYHVLGSSNSLGMRFLMRNCFFEPSLSGNSDQVAECLRNISIAFRWHKPAVICTHRLNYIGSLQEKNRQKNLKLLSDLLRQILKSWPDAEFITSDKLGDLIINSEKSSF
jgi:hypothetical protein